MRFLIALIVALAGFKILAYQYLYKAGMTEALLAAYQAKALTACSRSSAASARSGGYLWQRPLTENVQIGDGEASVPFWRTDHPMWQRRFQNPQLILTSQNSGQKVQCLYDVVAGRVTVRPM